MKRGLALICIVVVVIASIAWASRPKQADVSRTKWEYKHYSSAFELINANTSIDSEKLHFDRVFAVTEQALNILGGEGWELIQISDNGYIFKRPTN